MPHTVSTMPILILQPDLSCGICMEPLTSVHTSHGLQCCNGSKVVHTRCLLQWYVKQRETDHDITCPFCRATILSVAEFDLIYTFDANTQATCTEASETLEPPPLYSDANFVHSSDNTMLHPPTHLANMYVLQLTSVAYVFFFINLFFVMTVLVRQLS